MSFSICLRSLLITFRAWRQSQLEAMAQAVPYPLTQAEWALIQEEEARCQVLEAAAEPKRWVDTSGQLVVSYAGGRRRAAVKSGLGSAGTLAGQA